MSEYKYSDIGRLHALRQYAEALEQLNTSFQDNISEVFQAILILEIHNTENDLKELEKEISGLDTLEVGSVVKLGRKEFVVTSIGKNLASLKRVKT